MMKYVPVIFLLLVCMTPGTAWGQTEKELDTLIFSEKDEKNVSNPNKSDKKSPLELFGFFQNESRMSVGEFNNHSDGEIVKFESRIRLNSVYTLDSFIARASLDFYFNPETYDEYGKKNEGRINAQEMYLAGGKSLRFKIGKQLFLWGTADVFNVVNSLDQLDMREFLTFNKDDKYRGVYAFSLKYVLAEYSAEAVCTPLNEPTLMGEGFWKYEHDKVAGMNVELVDPYVQRASLSDSSFALRLGGTWKNLDLHFSYYNGMNKTLVFRPEISGMVTGAYPLFDVSDASITFESCRKRINTIGYDIAFTVGKLSVRAEAAYTPDMCAVEKAEVDDIVLGLSRKASGTYTELVPTDRVPYLAYTVGADYNLWGNNGIVLVEWTQSELLTGKEKYNEAYMNKILLLRIGDKFFNESLELNVETALHLASEKRGNYVKCMVLWDLKNGFTLEGGAYVFNGRDDLFGPYDDKDLVYIKARFEF